MPTVVVVDNGKYTFIVDQGRISILRFGKPWIEQFAAPGVNAVMALIFELEEARSTK